jgi:hypothetical protein
MGWRRRPAWLAALGVYLVIASYLLASPRRAWFWPTAILGGLSVGWSC